MEIEIDGCLNISINEKDKSALVADSPKAKGVVLVPNAVNFKGQTYKIISIKTYAFSNCNIELLTFPENSKIISFKSGFLSMAHIKKLKIPNSFRELEDDWCKNLFDLVEIEISSKNTYFQYYQNNFLLGKSDGNSDKFDILHYARYDIKDAKIPSQIKIVKNYSFYQHDKLKSIVFPENSMLKKIPNDTFTFSTIQELFLPASVEEIGDACFSAVQNLVHVEVSSKNKHFQVFDKKYLLKKTKGSKLFDMLFFRKT